MAMRNEKSTLAWLAGDHMTSKAVSSFYGQN